MGNYVFDEVEDGLSERSLYRLNVVAEGVEKVASGPVNGGRLCFERDKIRAWRDPGDHDVKLKLLTQYQCRQKLPTMIPNTKS